MKAIAYSLFGFNKAKYENCFTFDSYLSGLMLSIRFNRLVYPDWITVLETDTSTYTAYAPLFSYLSDRNILRIENVSKKINNNIILNEISFSIEIGEIFGLLILKVA